jgi:hypothetical protein
MCLHILCEQFPFVLESKQTTEMIRAIDGTYAKEKETGWALLINLLMK